MCQLAFYGCSLHSKQQFDANEMPIASKKMKTSEKLKVLYRIVVYATLTGVSVPLINGIYQEYLEGKTDFYTTKEPIEIKDNPAVLVRFFSDHSIQFGDDYTVRLLHWNEEQNEYLEDPNDVILYRDRHHGSGMAGIIVL